jgi:GNAT superfamily N-acetyltransferase
MKDMRVPVGVLAADAIAGVQPALVRLLQDAVDSGASIGFLPPLAEAEAAAYWATVADAVRDGSRVLLVAPAPDEPAGLPVGAVQLDLAMRANGRHRAEVAKLMVDRSVRRRGVGRALMTAVEAEARRLGRTTLHLDTREGDPSERLYQGLGWERAGAIPRWARSGDGTLHTTVFYYRLLDSA